MAPRLPGHAAIGCAHELREVSVIEVKKVLRLWLVGHSLRSVTNLAGVDRKAVRRYLAAAQTVGGIVMLTGLGARPLAEGGSSTPL